MHAVSLPEQPHNPMSRGHADRPPHLPPQRPWPEPAAPSPPRPRARPASAISLGPRAWVEPSALEFSFSRSGGPGGQHVNKTETKAELRVPIAAIGGLDSAALIRLESLAGAHLVGAGADTALRFAASEHRSQKANRDECMERLHDLVLRASIPPKRRRKTKPTRGSVERRLESKRRESEKKARRRGE
jgi:ribosome-associated protein